MPTTQRRVNKKYKGLPSYSDSINKENPWGFEAPYFLAGVVKDSEDIYSDTAPEPVGQFELNDEAIADEEIGAISKSEVYFKRPLDLDYFKRADENEEYGSALNPFWQARLIEPTYTDRIFALAVQQKQAFGELDTLVEFATSVVDSIPSVGDIENWIGGP